MKNAATLLWPFNLIIKDNPKPLSKRRNILVVVTFKGCRGLYDKTPQET